MNERTVLRPSLVPIRNLALSSTEAFVFTQIDGTSSLSDVADLTGVPLETVITIAKRLEDLGAVDGDNPAKMLQLVPRRTTRDLYAMKMEPSDAFLLSCVDGEVSIAALAEIVACEPAKAMRSVQALVAAGALELGPREERAPALSSRRTRVAAAAIVESPRPASRSSLQPPKTSLRPSRSSLQAPKRASRSSIQAPKRTSRSSLQAAKRASRASLQAMKAAVAAPERTSLPPRASVSPKASTKPPASPKISSRPPATPPPASQEAESELDAETMAKIEAALRGLAGPTHYAVLGVAETVSSKDLRRAYFGLAATLHPDRYFRKKLGSYKKVLADAFQKVTASYELLRVEGTRAQYDATLPQGKHAPASASVPAPPPAAPPKATRPSKAFKKASVAKMAAAAASSDPPPARSSKSPNPPKTPPAPAPPVAERPPGDAAPERTSHVATPPPSGPRVTMMSKAEQVLVEAQKALIAGDGLGASNLYRLAIQYVGDDVSMRSYAESGLADARSMLADTYAKNARAAEKDGKWPAAVNSYGKAFHLRPTDPELCDRLANALREEGQDLIRATEVAQLAVSRAPRRAGYKKTLGRIHAEAGNRTKALEQLEGAFALEPDDETGRLIAVLRKSR